MKMTPYNKKKVDAAPLSELLPLKIPFSMWIDPTNKCNFRCSFCPTGNPSLLDTIRRPTGYMNFHLFKKIIDDISFLCTNSCKKLSRLHLYKDGEPLLHKNLGSMIAYAKRKKVSDSVEITTNAAALTSKRAIEIINSELDVIRISIEHVNDKGYKEATKTFSNYNKIVQNVRNIYEEKNKRNSKLHIYVKIVNIALTDNDKNKFISDFSGISDSINIDYPMGWSRSFEKEVKLNITSQTGMDGVTEKKSRIVCPEPFSKLAVNFDGTVSVCCVDWSHGTVVGDLSKSSLFDIWHGDELKEFRLKHLQGKRGKITACSNCDYLLGLAQITNLDNDADRLLTLYQ